MFTDVVSEVLATFFFTATIFAVAKEALAPLLIGLALAASILFASKFGKAFVNPAVALGFWARGDIKLQAAIIYVVAEVLGALLAVVWWKFANGQKLL